MKRLLLIFLSLLMLCGCGNPEEPTIPVTEPTPIVTEAPTESAGLYDPTHELEALTGGALKVFPLEYTYVGSTVPLGEDLLVFAQESRTLFVTLLRGEQLYEVASAALPPVVYLSNPNFHISEKGIVYYDEDTGDLVYLDLQFREVSRLALPEEMQGEPILSADRKSLYYLTEDSLREMDLELGIDRLIRQLSHDVHYIVDLHCDDTILECCYHDGDRIRHHLFFQLSTGELMVEIPGDFELTTGFGRFFAEHQDGVYPEKLIGAEDGEILMLHMPDYEAEAYPVLEQSAVVTVTYGDTATVMDYYRLDDGTHPYSLTLPGNYTPMAPVAHPSGDALWLTVYDSNLDKDLLCRWDLEQSTVADDTVYIGLRWTPDNPDTYGLEKCAELAARISEKHGVEILTWTDATAVQSRDHSFEPEYQAAILDRYLNELDRILSRYPAGMLSQAVSEMGDGILRIGLVRSITGLSGAESLTAPAGLQFWQEENGNPYLILQAADGMAPHLHHELFHIIESRIFSLSQALDDWDDLNPKGFQYDYSYLYYADHDDRHLIDGETRAFIDYYSMTFPKEDRARIMEYAMVEGKEDCFASDTMQRKLRAICMGIRKAYDLKDVTLVLPWEQYLKEPITKVK